MNDIKIEELSSMLETLTNRIDDLTKALKNEKEETKEEIKELIKEEDTILEKLTSKIDELTGVITEKKEIYEEKIKENPLAYLVGAFVGGIAIGFLIKRKEE